MPSLKHTAFYFIAGIFVSFMLFSLSSCPKSSTTAPVEQKESYSESPELKSFTGKIQSTLESGVAENIINITNKDYQADAKEYLEGSTPEKIKKLGEAFRHRKLIFANDRYAEYELSIDGFTFTIACGNSGDKDWKLLRY